MSCLAKLHECPVYRDCRGYGFVEDLFDGPDVLFYKVTEFEVKRARSCV